MSTENLNRDEREPELVVTEAELRKWDEDEDLEETLGERLIGLTEMFPDWLRNCVSSTASGSVSGVKHLYKLSRNVMWIFFSSSAILMAPVIFEIERAQMEEMHKQQQRQILLGPNAALAGGQPHFPMPIPPGAPAIK